MQLPHLSSQRFQPSRPGGRRTAEPFRDTSRNASGPAGTPWRVLVIEDDAAMARLLAAALASEGAEVRSAGDGQAALEITSSWEPDVIVLDLLLPELDGAGFVAGYRQRRGQAAIVIVSGSPDAIATSDRIGARACLPKPFDLDLLLELVRPEDDGLDGSRT